VDLLQASLTPDQGRLLTLLADAYRQDQGGERVWPKWPYVWSRLGIGAPAAEQVLRSLPTLGRRVGIYGMLYGLVWTDPDVLGFVGISDDARIGLTMAGLWRAGEHDLVGEFLTVVAAAVRAYDGFQPGLNDTARPTLTSAQAVLDGVLPGTLLQVDDVLAWRRWEPPLWRGAEQRTSDGTGWTLALSDRIDGFRGVTTAQEYLAAVAADVALDETLNTPLFTAITGPAPAPAAPWWRRISRTAITWVGTAVTAAAAAVFHDQLVRLFSATTSWGEHLLR
jgi:hypothetical protein